MNKQTDDFIKLICQNDDKQIIMNYYNENKELIDIHANNDEAFRWSCARRHIEVVKLLLEKGANIHANN